MREAISVPDALLLTDRRAGIREEITVPMMGHIIMAAVAKAVIRVVKATATHAVRAMAILIGRTAIPVARTTIPIATAPDTRAAKTMAIAARAATSAKAATIVLKAGIIVLEAISIARAVIVDVNMAVVTSNARMAARHVHTIARAATAREAMVMVLVFPREDTKSALLATIPMPSTA